MRPAAILDQQAEPPKLGLVDAIGASMGSVCLRSVTGRSFIGRVLRQHLDDLHVLDSSDDVLLVYDRLGARRVERWYDRKLSSVGSGPERITVLPAGRSSGWRLPDPVEVVHLYISRRVIALHAERDLSVDPARVEFIDSFAVEDAVGAALAQVVLASPADGNPLDGLFLDTVGQAAALHLLRRHALLPPSAARTGEQPNALSAERLRRVCEYIEAHIDGDLTLEDLAAAACLSPYHLSRCFRRTTGTTLHAYVVARRTEHARTLLAQPRTTLADIAYRCGFASQSHFTAVFKKATGMTPGAYRRTLSS